MKAMEKDWYQKSWRLDIQNMSWVEDTNRQVDFLIKQLQLKGTEKILDLACEFGRHSLEFARRGYDVKERLYQLEEVIEELPFMRISKSMIVNIEKILHISPALGGRFEAVLENDEKVIISRLYVPILKNKLGVSR